MCGTYRKLNRVVAIAPDLSRHNVDEVTLVTWLHTSLFQTGEVAYISEQILVFRIDHLSVRRLPAIFSFGFFQHFPNRAIGQADSSSACRWSVCQKIVT